MKVILVILPLTALVFAGSGGKMGEVSDAILQKSGEAVTLAISICGIMCFWCGITRVAEKAGLVEKFAKLLSKPLSFLFKGLEKGGHAMQLISLNIAANILGLGNATTPLGIKAMSAIAKEEGSDTEASDNMIMLAVINTASLQILPTTAAALRTQNGAERPMEILPCVWIVSVYAALVAVGAAKLMGYISKRRRKRCG